MPLPKHTHAKRGALAKKAKLFAEVMEGVELMIVSDCRTMDELRNKFKAGTFDADDWLAPQLAKIFADRPVTPGLRRTITRAIGKDYRRRIAAVLQEEHNRPRSRFETPSRGEA